MSYILDALRKSEQERLRGQPLSTLGHSRIVGATSERPRWLLPLLAANLVALTMLGVWWLRSAAVPPESGAAATGTAMVPSTPMPRAAPISRSRFLRRLPI